MPTPDESYHGGTGIYREQGGDRLVVGTAGEIVLGTTNGVVLTSSGITLGTTNDGALTANGLILGSSGYVQQTVTAGVTTAALSAMGISTIRSTTAAGAQVFSLAAPIIGVTKTILCTQANATDTCTISAGTAVSIANTTTAASQNLYKFVAPGMVQLIGITTAHWGILTPNVSTVAYSTS